MHKTRIALDLLLPEIPDEKDACVQRMMQQLTGIKGMEQVHIVPGNGQQEAKRCFQDDPDVSFPL